MLSIDRLKEIIIEQHEGDEKQLEVIFTEDPRVIVEAPAGYGKTTTMISRIAYLFAIGKIPNPKRILGLTFSVNAALKIKREIVEKLPKLINSKNDPTVIGNKSTVTNYHGFCKIILKKYGYLLYKSLRKDINLFKAIGENEIKKSPKILSMISSQEVEIFKEIESIIKSGTYPNDDNLKEYFNIISKYLLPNGLITHNAIILLTIEIFSKYPEVKRFYQNYYPLIIVDEFQDTNCIAWKLLKSLISNNTQLLFLGDPLQRIYGFIGALPDIMSVSANEYQMKQIVLNKNYRFRHNGEMLKLDANIRANAQYGFICSFEDTAKLSAFWGTSQEDESNKICSKISALTSADVNAKIAILCRGRSNNSNAIEQKLNELGINYFYGMFTDEDSDYIDFHINCQSLFIEKFGQKKTVSKKALTVFVKNIRDSYSGNSNKTIVSLICLLEALVEKVSVDYATISPEDKYSLLLDIFENRQLKQAMEYIDSNVVITTIHGAKGLEWEFVFLPDVEKIVFPNYYTCRDCNSYSEKVDKHVCRIPSNNSEVVKKMLLEELSVFYVGVTRAKKQVYVSASARRYNTSGKNMASDFSCLVGLNGIKLINGKET